MSTLARSTAVRILADVPVSPNFAARQANVVCAYPSMCRAAGGRLVCVYRQGPDKHSRSGVLMSAASDDHGASWSQPTVVFDGLAGDPPQSVHAGVVAAPSGGELLALFKTVEVNESQAFIFSDEGRRLRQWFYVARSADAGRTWSEPAVGVLPETPRDHYVGTRPLELPGGELFLAVEATVDGREIALGTTSSDGGRSWQPLWTALDDPTGRLSFGDPRLVLLPSGAIRLFAWTWVTSTEETLPVHSSLSADGGRTWSPPQSTGVASQIMTPLAAADGRLVAASNFRDPPAGIRLWTSADEGRTWSSGPIVMWDDRAERIVGEPLEASAAAEAKAANDVWGNLPSFRFGTPDIAETSPGQFVLSYYATTGGVLGVRACRFELPPR